MTPACHQCAVMLLTVCVNGNRITTNAYSMSILRLVTFFAPMAIRSRSVVCSVGANAFSRCRIDPLRLIILRCFLFCCHSTIDIGTFRILGARIRVLVANIRILIVRTCMLTRQTLFFLVFATGLSNSTLARAATEGRAIPETEKT
jgi:hypothetical protein